MTSPTSLAMPRPTGFDVAHPTTGPLLPPDSGQPDPGEQEIAPDVR
ncbi:MAG: hypothetical protein L0H41_15320 [Microlunatus sp.]|nr:hypothetical protein [Microlunatus sp.]